MFRGNNIITVYKVFLLIILRTSAGKFFSNVDFRKCLSNELCMKISNCTSLNYNYTLLSPSQINALSIRCEDSIEGAPQVCCSTHTNETDPFNASICGKELDKPKILGGRAALINEFPWMALLDLLQAHSSDIFRCGGTLINNRYVLTAAHCLGNDTLKLLRVHLGKYDRNKTENCGGDGDCGDPTVIVYVEKIIKHPDHNGVVNDIGLIRLSRTVSYTDFIKPICLPTSHSIENATLEIAGWGKGAKSTAKQILEVQLSNFTYCTKKYGNNFLNETLHICAGGVPREGACEGDSGGPLMARKDDQYAIEGIIYGGFNLCNLCEIGINGINRPIIFTNVSSFQDWIKSEIKK